MKKYWAIILAAGLAGCATTSQPPLTAGEPPPMRETHAPYFMAPLDQATLEFRDGSRRIVQINNEGSLDFDGGSKWVKGLPLEEFRGLLRKRYPNVRSIQIEEFRPNRVTVLGEVFHQIHTDLTDGPMRVLDAVAAANGFTPLANKRRVRLLRQNAGAIQVYELDLREMMRGDDLVQNLLLKPGDVISVPRNFL
ncbi:MAG TPA: hypothetical protein VIS74_00900 [Chthoniobacterales bacterium]